MNLLTLLGLQAAGAVPGGDPVRPNGGGIVAAPSLPTEPPAEDIKVVNTPPSKLQDKGPLQYLFGDTFAPGHIGGNIIGRIADAFLVQGGAQPMYAPKLEQLRLSEALRHFQTEPEMAIERATKISPQFSMLLQDRFEDNKRQQAEVDALQTWREAQAEAAKARAREEVQKRDDTTRDRYIQMMYSARRENYQRIKQLADRYAASRNWTPDVTFPDDFDEAAVKGYAMTTVPIDKQIDNEETKDYHSKQLGIRRQEVGISARRAAQQASHDSVMEGIAARNATTAEKNSTTNANRAVAKTRKKPTIDPKTGLIIP